MVFFFFFINFPNANKWCQAGPLKFKLMGCCRWCQICWTVSSWKHRHRFLWTAIRGVQKRGLKDNKTRLACRKVPQHGSSLSQVGFYLLPLFPLQMQRRAQDCEVSRQNMSLFKNLQAKCIQIYSVGFFFSNKILIESINLIISSLLHHVFLHLIKN